MLYPGIFPRHKSWISLVVRLGILYNLRRINEVCKEHIDNNFLPLPPRYTTEYEMIRTQISTLFNDTLELMRKGDTETISTLRQHCDEIKDTVSDTYFTLDFMRSASWFWQGGCGTPSRAVWQTHADISLPPPPDPWDGNRKKHMVLSEQQLLYGHTVCVSWSILT